MGRGSIIPESNACRRMDRFSLRLRGGVAAAVVLTLLVSTLRPDGAFGATITHTTVTLSDPQCTAGAAVGNKLFLASSRSLEVFKLATGERTVETHPAQTGTLAAVSLGNTLMVCGYTTGAGSQTVVDTYDLSTGLWSRQLISGGRISLAAASAGGMAFFAGGSDLAIGSQPYSDFVDIYDSTSGLWSTAQLSQGRIGLAAGSAGGKVFFAGGFTARVDGVTIPSDVVDIYDTSTGEWSTARLSVARWELAAASVGSRIFFGGGSVVGGGSNVVDIYDTATGVWSTASLSVARRRLAAGSADGRVFFAGGVPSGSSNSTTLVEIFDIATGEWSITQLSRSAHSLVAVSTPDSAFFAGGYILSHGTMTQFRGTMDVFTVVPEPATIALFAAAALGLLARRRR